MKLKLLPTKNKEPFIITKYQSKYHIVYYYCGSIEVIRETFDEANYLPIYNNNQKCIGYIDYQGINYMILKKHYQEINRCFETITLRYISRNFKKIFKFKNSC